MTEVVLIGPVLDSEKHDRVTRINPPRSVAFSDGMDCSAQKWGLTFCPLLLSGTFESDGEGLTPFLCKAGMDRSDLPENNPDSFGGRCGHTA